MMPDNLIKEQVSLTYVQAVTARSGHELTIRRVDYRGIDGTVENPLLRGVNRVDFQLKSTTVFDIRNTDIIYDLRVQNYNLLASERDIPRVFILFIMPRDETQWLVQSPEELCLRKCAYWYSLMGEDPSSNRSTVRISVPLTNVLDEGGLRDIFDHFGLI